MVGVEGLEPPTPCVSGKCSKPTELHTNILWTGRELNPRHLNFQSSALPPELPVHFGYQYVKEQKKPEPCEFGFPFLRL